ncbi:MAG TPA: hypothetical protein VNI83_06720 [Vicinamibacterales bacterium]|nr:hypothetical protein [Vicinamibacterales bacterium]
MPYRYEPEILAALAGLGIAPTEQTPPERARELANDLYRYELRRLRDRLRRREIEKSGYAAQVVALRRKYWVLSVPVTAWAARDAI